MNTVLSGKKGQTGGRPPQHGTKNSDTEGPPPEPSRKVSGGIIANQLGIKLKQQPPPLPKTFEQSPLFDNQTSSQYFRI